jgi:3-dehydroquinate dehydratase-1
MTRKPERSKGPLVVGTVSTMPGLRRLLKIKAIPCHVIEIRFDLIGARHFDESVRLIPVLRKKRKPRMPILGTFRSHREGGRWRLTERQRISRINAFYPFVDLLDVEASSKSTLRKFLRKAEIPVVVSWHHFRATPPLAQLKKFVRSVLRHRETIAKIACNVRNPKDMEALRTLLRSSPPSRVAVVGMGSMGSISRFWLPIHGSLLTYGYLDQAAASGQVPVDELAEFFRVH